jgi:hypothetical protein
MVVAAERVAAFSFVRRPSHPALVFGSLKLMSALGQNQTFCDARAMSALPLKADMPVTIVERAPSRGTRFGRTPGVVC